MRADQSRLTFSLLTAALAAIALPAAAQNTISYQSEPGDPVGLGETRTFTGEVDASLNNYDGQVLSAAAFSGGDSYLLILRPPSGQSLGVGTYENAVDYHDDPSRPRMSFIAAGRSCAALSGQFTIHEIQADPADYVEKLRVSFEQRCAGAPGKLVGTVFIDNPPGPPLVTMDVRWDKHALLEPWGDVRLTGTTLCNKPVAEFGLGLEITQQRGRGPVATGSPDRPIPPMDCTNERRSFSVTLSPRAGATFTHGPATLNWSGIVWDYTDYPGWSTRLEGGEVKVVIMPPKSARP